MINYEFRKAFSNKTILSVLIFIMILFILNTIYIAKMVDNTNIIYDGKYSEETYNEIKQKRNEYVFAISEINEDEEKISEINKKYADILSLYPVFENIHNRIENIRILKTYENWSSDLQYLYDDNENYKIENFSGWQNFLNYEGFFIASFVSVVVASVSVCCSDSKAGNRKIITSSKAGKNELIIAKKTTLLLLVLGISAVYFVLQITIFLILGLKLSLISSGLYQVDGFLFASSFTSIVKYIFLELIGLLIVNAFAAFFVYFISTIFDKHIYSYVLVAFATAFSLIIKRFTWITPASFYEPNKFFCNISEISIGNVVISKYFIIMIIIIVTAIILTIIGDYVNRKIEEK